MTSPLDMLSWRAAIKTYDTTKKVSEENVKTIIEAARLSPSSHGIQPYKIVQINNPEVRRQIYEVGWQQSAIIDASHLLVFASRTEVTHQDIKEYVQRVADQRDLSLENLTDYHTMLREFIDAKPDQESTHWAGRQVYLPLGMALTMAAYLKVDTTPMEGFQNDKVDEILDLSSQGYTSRALLALGYRSQDDTYSKMPKVRKTWEEFVTIM